MTEFVAVAATDVELNRQIERIRSLLTDGAPASAFPGAFPTGYWLDGTFHGLTASERAQLRGMGM